MVHCNDAYTENQLKRWIRPDARHFMRPDWRRFVRPGYAHEFPFELYERKYSPDQPRDDHGRWTSEGSNGDKPGQQFAARISPGLAAACAEQYRLDAFICNTVGTRSCWEQAMFRRAQCLIGGYVPPIYH